MAEAKWYIAHTYSGYENKVKANIEMTVQNREIGDQILEVAVPLEKAVEVRNGVKKTVDRKMFPGYVFVHMEMNDETWYVVRNTRGVTGFVGPGSKPVPLTEAEVKNIGLDKTPGEKISEVELDFRVVDSVVILEGNWENKTGIVKKIDEHKQTVIISIEMFGRETPVELSFTAVKAEKY
ncbi:MAG: transcription termination/antitermination protein NusG [Lachnospiraceae bacterium]|nr:transcription termination/antitermination protein NusG [Lachnospiraceae bacterium]